MVLENISQYKDYLGDVFNALRFSGSLEAVEKFVIKEYLT